MAAGVAVANTSTTRAAAADGCLPTNGLMNLNDADDLLAGTVRLTSSVTVQLGTGDVNWARTGLGDGPARLLYSLKWIEELVREHRRTGDSRYLDRAIAIVLDFAADNPVDAGPDPADAWYPMYAGQRTTAIACVAAVSSDTRIDAALRTHAHWLAGEVDALPAWNQAIDPHLGLLMGGCELGVVSWRTQAHRGFARLIRGMIDADGVLAEQAPGYGRFVWDRWGTVEAQLATCAMAPPPEIPGRRAALLEWLAWMSAPDGTVTPTGDSYRTIVPPAPDGSPTEYTVSQGTTGQPPAATVRVFDGGYVVGRDSWTDLPASTYWTLRFGPGRDLHGHEDHTSVTFWSAGNEVLIDSGHGGYGDTAYREALRGPESHNVLMLPGVDFRIRQATELVRSETGTGWRFDEVRSDAFGIQNRKLVHAPRTRGLLVLPDDGMMIVQDQAFRVSPGLFEQLWHLVPGAVVTSSSRSGIVARHPEGDTDIHVLRVALPHQELPRGATTVVEGQTNPYLGWFSEADRHREPAPVVRMRSVGSDARMVTLITTTGPGGSLSTSARETPGGWVIDITKEGVVRTVGIGVDGHMQLGEPDPSAMPLQQARRCSLDPAVAPAAQRC